MKDIYKSSHIINSAVSEIASETQENAESIQEQTNMTTAIQESIQNITKKAEIIVQIANDSQNALMDGITIIKQLEAHSVKVQGQVKQEKGLLLWRNRYVYCGSNKKIYRKYFRNFKRIKHKCSQCSNFCGTNLMFVTVLFYYICMYG